MARKPAKAAKRPRKAVRRPAKPAKSQEPPRPKHGAFMWNELMTRDDGRAVGFFERLIGWVHEDWKMPDGVYRIMKNRGTSTAGIMRMTEPQFPAEVPPHWMGYVAVDDVDRRCARAKKLGGDVVQPPTDIPEVGRFCVIKDPTGAVIGLLTPKGGVTKPRP